MDYSRQQIQKRTTSSGAVGTTHSRTRTPLTCRPSKRKPCAIFWPGAGWACHLRLHPESHRRWPPDRRTDPRLRPTATREIELLRSAPCPVPSQEHARCERPVDHDAHPSAASGGLTHRARVPRHAPHPGVPFESRRAELTLGPVGYPDRRGLSFLSPCEETVTRCQRRSDMKLQPLLREQESRRRFEHVAMQVEQETRWAPGQILHLISQVQRCC